MRPRADDHELERLVVCVIFLVLLLGGSTAPIVAVPIWHAHQCSTCMYKHKPDYPC